eukprot:GSMAST32.ASY1.ANO1.573.1 assembled CDS
MTKSFLPRSTIVLTHKGVLAQSRAFGCFASEGHFKEVAGNFLEDLSDALSDLEEKLDASEMIEVECMDGVLTLSLGDHGTWVLNRQGPNQQIWWSSPLSGPRRYNYIAGADEEWVGVRDGKGLLELLRAELISIYGEKVITELQLDASKFSTR